MSNWLLQVVILGMSLFIGQIIFPKGIIRFVGIIILMIVIEIILQKLGAFEG